jgi:hypothetical protein
MRFSAYAPAALYRPPPPEYSWLSRFATRREVPEAENNVSGSRARPVGRADNLTVICEPIV